MCIPFCDQSVQTTRISLSLRGFAYRLAADHRSQDLSRRISNRDSHSEGTHEKSETHFLIEGSHLFENNETGERFEVRKGGYFYLPGKILHEAWVPAGAKAIIILESGWKVDWLNGAPTSKDLRVSAPMK